MKYVSLCFFVLLLCHQANHHHHHHHRLPPLKEKMEAAEDRKWEPSIYWAADHGRIEMLKLFLEHYGHLAIQTACCKGVFLASVARSSDPEVLRWLFLDIGIDPMISVDELQATMLHIAAGYASARNVRVLLSHGKVPADVRGKGQMTPLHYACGNGKIFHIDQERP